jgi:hypothetical protein
MTTNTTLNKDTEQRTLFIKMALSAWQTQNDRVAKLLNALSAEQLAAPVAPERNSGIYLIGHLVAVSDGMLPLLGFGEKLYPQLEAPFIKNPDSPEAKQFSLDELKKYWADVNAALDSHLNNISADEWFARHNAVSADDFAKEPHRNKLNIIINRTNHTAYHLGQLVFLKKS